MHSLCLIVDQKRKKETRNCNQGTVTDKSIREIKRLADIFLSYSQPQSHTSKF